MVNIKHLIFKAYKYKYNFQSSETIWSFIKSIFDGKITLYDADEDQSDLLVDIISFR